IGAMLYLYPPIWPDGAEGGSHAASRADQDRPAAPAIRPMPGIDAALFAALASPRRLQILQWLKDPQSHFPPQKDGDLLDDGVCVLFIADKLGVAQPTATSHLQALARAGVVTLERPTIRRRLARRTHDGQGGSHLRRSTHRATARIGPLVTDRGPPNPLPRLAKVQPGGEVGAVGVQHADAGLGVLAKALVGSGQLLERGQIESVALVGPVDANQQHVVVEIDGDALIQGRSSSPRLPVAIEASLRFERIADAARRLDDTVGLASTPKVAWV